MLEQRTGHLKLVKLGLGKGVRWMRQGTVYSTIVTDWDRPLCVVCTAKRRTTAERNGVIAVITMAVLILSAVILRKGLSDG